MFKNYADRFSPNKQIKTEIPKIGSVRFRNFGSIYLHMPNPRHGYYAGVLNIFRTMYLKKVIRSSKMKDAKIALTLIGALFNPSYVQDDEEFLNADSTPLLQ